MVFSILKIEGNLKRFGRCFKEKSMRIIIMTKFSYYCIEYVFAILSMFAVMYNHFDLNDISFCNNHANYLLMIISLVLFFQFYKFMLIKINGFSLLSISIGVFAGIINVLCQNFLLYENFIYFKI